MGSKKSDFGDGASPGKIFIGGLAKDTTLVLFLNRPKYTAATRPFLMIRKWTLFISLCPPVYTLNGRFWLPRRRNTSFWRSLRPLMQRIWMLYSRLVKLMGSNSWMAPCGCIILVLPR